MSKPFFPKVKVQNATTSRNRVGRAERSLSELRRGEANPVEICTTFALSWLVVLHTTDHETPPRDGVALRFMQLFLPLTSSF